MNRILARWNGLGAVEAADEVLACCGSTEWARRLTARRPLANEAEALAASSEVWRGLSETDWQEAFDSHPRIGERKAKSEMTEQTLRWSEQEQSRAVTDDENAKARLAEANRAYEERFGRIFIICASGRTQDEILREMERRMGNDAMSELAQAAEEQRKITELRLRRWLEWS